VAWDRIDKLNEIIKEKVAQIVLYRLKDPRIGFVTITKARLSRDRTQCQVFYSVYGTEGSRSATKRALEDARGHIQTEIGRTLQMRQIPHLTFMVDESIEGAMRVTKLLDELEAERKAKDTETGKGDGTEAASQEGRDEGDKPEGEE
jgi:ribosome-binding factor A